MLFLTGVLVGAGITTWLTGVAISALLQTTNGEAAVALGRLIISFAVVAFCGAIGTWMLWAGQVGFGIAAFVLVAACVGWAGYRFSQLNEVLSRG